MVLSNIGILENIEKGNIKISNFDVKRLNPNSYNVTLFNELQTYRTENLDLAEDTPTENIFISESGLWLEPNKLYLGRTNEHTSTENLVPMIEGRSSTARKGLYVHVSAGFGDNGFRGYWTLEIHCIQPVKIYPNIEIAQLYWHTLDKIGGMKYEGKYQDNNGIQSSKFYEEIK